MRIPRQPSQSNRANLWRDRRWMGANRPVQVETDWKVVGTGHVVRTRRRAPASANAASITRSLSRCFGRYRKGNGCFFWRAIGIIGAAVLRQAQQALSTAKYG
jgi:hypothetical protein